MSKIIEINTPLDADVIAGLNCGDIVHITGTIYPGRDAAHKRMAEMLAAGQPPPFHYPGSIIFYAGPAPARPGDIIGSIGPTTAGRMDLYAPSLIKAGLVAMIGKGNRSEAVKQAIIEHGGIYFAGVGGIAALMSRCVTKVDIIAFEDLGTEAVRRLSVVRLPAIVAIDCKGNDIYDRNSG
ncbi:MAG: FumA C-terminus/TtdB family hydratase beta subunit [Clostridiales bacterium]|jgi:fumarate hydratase subunit beta|nr:FumA C-terminus/TtdB family hydratase beta subunit [Clostridiales bacterium]